MKIKIQKGLRSIMVIGLIVALSGCSEDDELGFVTTESLSLPDFNQVRVESVGKVYVRTSTEYAIEVRTHTEVLPNVSTTVAEGMLTIDLRGNYKNMDVIEYVIYVPTLELIEVNYVVDFYAREGIVTDNLRVIQNGVSKIYLDDVQAQSIEIISHDVGDIHVTGFTDYLSIRKDDVGQVNALNLQARVANVTLDDVTEAHVNVTDELTVTLDDLGQVYYIGDPIIYLSGNPNRLIKL